MPSDTSSPMHPKADDLASQLHGVEEWKRLILPLLQAGTTPFYLFSAVPLAQASGELEPVFRDLPITHWLSAKTQPLPPLFRWWKKQGRPIEVVSEIEFLAAQACGFSPDQILVNGPAKHRWLVNHPVPRLNVNFDSTAEIEVLGPIARKLNWRLGVRVNTPAEFDPDKPDYPTQFGFSPEELHVGVAAAQRWKLEFPVLHLHLRSHVARPEVYETAASQAMEIATAAGLRPEILDLGGGFPPPRIRSKGGDEVAGGFSLPVMAEVYRGLLRRFPQLHSLWLENGSWWTARSGVLVVRVLDAKDHRGKRNLVCDGGRTMNALFATWENHDFFLLPERSGEETITTVNGPTCMAFDKLVRRRLPRSVTVGDCLVWMDAGAYHLPLETRFSHGLTAVYWHEEGRTCQARRPEGFEGWWNQWTSENESAHPRAESPDDRPPQSLLSSNKVTSS